MPDIIPEINIAKTIQKYPNNTFLITFNNSFGESLLFYECYKKLIKVFPNTRIDISFSEALDSFKLSNYDKDFKYDHVFEVEQRGLDSRDNVVRSYSRNLLGISEHDGLVHTINDDIASRFVVLGFYSDYTPVRNCIHRGLADMINRQLIENAFMPVLLDFNLPGVDKCPKYSVEDYTHLDKCKATLLNIASVLKHSRCFIGVESTYMLSALSILGPSRCLLIETQRGWLDKYKTKNTDLNIIYREDITPDVITDWVSKQ